MMDEIQLGFMQGLRRADIVLWTEPVVVKGRHKIFWDLIAHRGQSHEHVFCPGSAEGPDKAVYAFGVIHHAIAVFTAE